MAGVYDRIRTPVYASPKRRPVNVWPTDGGPLEITVSPRRDPRLYDMPAETMQKRDPLLYDMPPQTTEAPYYDTSQHVMPKLDQVLGAFAMMPVNMGRVAVDAAMAPGRAYNEGMTQDEMIRSSADLAGFVGLGGAGWAKVGGKPNTLGSAGGRVPPSTGGRVPGGADLPMDYASRMARAKEMGWRVDEPLYRGQPNVADTSFRPDYVGGTNHSVGAAWFSNDPSIANEYVPVGSHITQGPAEGSGMIKAFARGKEANITMDMGQDGYKALEKAYQNMVDDGYWYDAPDFQEFVDHVTGGRMWEGGPGGSYGLGFQNRVLSELADQGYDAVRLTDDTFGKINDSVVVFDPKDIRSPAAKFDPAKADSGDLLALTRKTTQTGRTGRPIVSEPFSTKGEAAIMDEAVRRYSGPQGPVTPPGIKAYHGSPHDFDFQKYGARVGKPKPLGDNGTVQYPLLDETGARRGNLDIRVLPDEIVIDGATGGKGAGIKGQATRAIKAMIDSAVSQGKRVRVTAAGGARPYWSGTLGMKKFGDDGYIMDADQLAKIQKGEITTTAWPHERGYGDMFKDTYGPMIEPFSEAYNAGRAT